MTPKSFNGAIIIYGPPGSGKGTQANIIGKYFNLTHLDTGRLVEKLVHNPRLKNDPIIKKERKNFDSGKLCTISWVVKIVKEEVKKIYKKGKGIIFSGSPRTLYEAKRLIPYLEKLYKKEKICVIRILIKPQTSIFRNSHRKVCEKCGYILVYSKKNKNLRKCPICNGKLIRRTLDDPKIIKIRIKEYKKRTEPIYKYLTKRGIKIIDINGEPSVEKVTKNIIKNLKNCMK